MKITAVPHSTARQAIANCKGAKGQLRAIRLNSGIYSVRQEEADRLEAARVQFAYLGLVNDRLCSVPVN